MCLHTVRIACSSQFDQKTDMMKETRQLYFNTPSPSRLGPCGAFLDARLGSRA
jgi:hypothetical protein